MCISMHRKLYVNETTAFDLYRTNSVYIDQVLSDDKCGMYLQIKYDVNNVTTHLVLYSRYKITLNLIRVYPSLVGLYRGLRHLGKLRTRFEIDSLLVVTFAAVKDLSAVAEVGSDRSTLTVAEAGAVVD